MSVKSRIFIAVLSLAGIALFSAAGLKRVSAQGVAAGTPATAVSRVAIVDIQGAIGATNEGKAALAAIQQRFAPKQAALDKQNQELEGLRKQLEAQGASLSDQERQSRVRNFEMRQKQFQRDYEDAQRELQQAEQEGVTRIAEKMVTVLDTYAKANGLTVVLDVSTPQTPVLWAGKEADITKPLIDAYNAGASAAAPAPKSAAPAPKSAAPAAKPPAPAPKTAPR